MARYDDEEKEIVPSPTGGFVSSAPLKDEREKWGTAEGVITGEAPHRGGVMVQTGPPDLGRDIKQLGRMIVGGIRPGEERQAAQRYKYPAGAFSPNKQIDKISSGIINDLFTNLALGQQSSVAETSLQPRSPATFRDTPGGGGIIPGSVGGDRGFTVEDLAGGGKKYSIEGGSIIAEPETPGTRLGDEMARTRLFQDARGQEAERMGMAEAPYKAREESIQRQRSDEAMAELEEQRELGIVPRSGMAAYEEAATKMRAEHKFEALLKMVPARQRAGIIQQRLAGEAGVVQEKVKGAAERSKAKEAGIIAAQKSQVEAAKLGIQAQDVASKIQLRNTEMKKVAEEYGLYKPMEARLKVAKDGVERAKIQRETYTNVIDKRFEATRKQFEQTYPLGMVNDPVAMKEWKKVEKKYMEDIQGIADDYPMPGQRQALPDGTEIVFDPLQNKYVRANQEE